MAARSVANTAGWSGQCCGEVDGTTNPNNGAAGNMPTTARQNIEAMNSTAAVSPLAMCARYVLLSVVVALGRCSILHRLALHVS